MNEGDMSSISQYVMSDGMKHIEPLKLIERSMNTEANLVDDFSQINDLFEYQKTK